MFVFNCFNDLFFPGLFQVILKVMMSSYASMPFLFRPSATIIAANEGECFGANAGCCRVIYPNTTFCKLSCYFQIIWTIKNLRSDSYHATSEATKMLASRVERDLLINTNF